MYKDYSKRESNNNFPSMYRSKQWKLFERKRSYFSALSSFEYLLEKYTFRRSHCSSVSLFEYPTALTFHYFRVTFFKWYHYQNVCN